jgi:hypothetical protein
MNITKTNLTTYATHIVDIETENTTYSVTLVEYDFYWDTRVLNVDECEEVEEGDPLYSELVAAAEAVVWNTPEQDSAGFTEQDRNSI